MGGGRGGKEKSNGYLFPRGYFLSPPISFPPPNFYFFYFLFFLRKSPSIVFKEGVGKWKEKNNEGWERRDIQCGSDFDFYLVRVGRGGR